MNKIGKILAVLLALVTLNSMYYFFAIAKVSFVEWLVFNACAPSSIAYLLSFGYYCTTQKRTVLHMAIIPLFFFGGLGLFLFPWSGFNLIAQVSHIVMVLNLFWVLAGTLYSEDYKAATIGLLMGMFIFLPFINFQQTYAYTHPESFQKILGIKSEAFQEKYGIR